MNKISENGFIITVDSFLGITLATIFIILALFYLSLISLDSWNAVDLKDSCSDLISVMEKNGVIVDALFSSSSEEISLILNSTPQNTCFELIIFDEESINVIHSIKTGCVKSSRSVFSVERSIVLNEGEGVSFFVARINGWFK
ncbi:MAG: hypothetical protein ACOX1V_04220 [Candidatus Iainarchaeum sp.]|nr:MAG: hypothetical protein BWY55_00560 [archaeon ADurb.Bin336]